jgi:hypothetical protein
MVAVAGTVALAVVGVLRIGLLVARASVAQVPPGACPARPGARRARGTNDARGARRQA